MERELVLISGLPGSGKSRLGRSMAEILHESNRSAEHISIGDRIRSIGSLAIHSTFTDIIHRHLHSADRHLPLSDEVAYGVVSEALLDSHETDLILLDGYPRNLNQYMDINQLAFNEDRYLRGMVITETSDEDMLSRLTMRQPRNFEGHINPTIARERLEMQRENLKLLHSELLINPSYRLHTQIVNTHGSKETSTRQGLGALQTFRRYR